MTYTVGQDDRNDVSIEIEETPGVLLDFIASTEVAEWGSGTNSVPYTLPGEIELTYGSSTADGNFPPFNNNVLEDESKTVDIL
jgi:hypothetical protein